MQLHSVIMIDSSKLVVAIEASLPSFNLRRFQKIWCALQAPYKAQLEPMLVQYVLPCFEAPAGHLRAKACWVTQQYADIKFAAGRGRGPTFLQLFQKTLSLLADPALPV